MTLDRIAEEFTIIGLSFRRNKNSIVIKTPFKSYITVVDIENIYPQYVIRDENTLNWFIEKVLWNTL